VANKLRGEVTISIGGMKYTMRPTFEAMCEIEDFLDMPIETVFHKIQLRDIRIGWIARIVYAGIAAAADEGDDYPSLADLGNAIRADGLYTVLNSGSNSGADAGAILKFLMYGIMGDIEVEKKLAEVKAKKEAEAKAKKEAEQVPLKE
jgi:hypothetical protein